MNYQKKNCKSQGVELVVKTVGVVCNNINNRHHGHEDVKHSAHKNLGFALEDIGPHKVEPSNALAKKFNKDLEHEVVRDEVDAGVCYKPVHLVTCKTHHHFFLEFVV